MEHISLQPNTETKEERKLVSSAPVNVVWMSNLIPKKIFHHKIDLQASLFLTVVIFYASGFKYLKGQFASKSKIQACLVLDISRKIHTAGCEQVHGGKKVVPLSKKSSFSKNVISVRK